MTNPRTACFLHSDETRLPRPLSDLESFDGLSMGFTLGISILRDALLYCPVGHLFPKCEKSYILDVAKTISRVHPRCCRLRLSFPLILFGFVLSRLLFSVNKQSLTISENHCIHKMSESTWESWRFTEPAAIVCNHGPRNISQRPQQYDFSSDKRCSHQAPSEQIVHMSATPSAILLPSHSRDPINLQFRPRKVAKVDPRKARR